MNRETKAKNQMNNAAGLEGGYDDQCRHKGISVGYIGNCSIHPNGFDDRAWGFFRPHPDASDRMIGRFASLDRLLDDYFARPAFYLKWATGAKS